MGIRGEKPQDPRGAFWMVYRSEKSQSSSFTR
jgi:hypothetical protein